MDYFQLFVNKWKMCVHFCLGIKKIPVVPVSYREKIRVGRSKIFFLEYFFHGFFNN